MYRRNNFEVITVAFEELQIDLPAKGEAAVQITVRLNMNRADKTEAVEKSGQVRLRRCPEITWTSRISYAGHLWPIFNHKVLNVAQLRLRLCSIRSTKSVPTSERDIVQLISGQLLTLKKGEDNWLLHMVIVPENLVE